MNPPNDFALSILLIAYRAADTIVAAIDAALAQTVACEIIVSDDCSPDDTFAVAQRHLAGYAGPHKVIVRQSETNRGISRHLSELAALAQGRIFIIMAGDDIARPRRAAATLAAFEANPEVYALGSIVDEIDMQGRPLRQGVRHMPAEFGLEYFARAGRLVTLLGASLALRREVFDRFGPLRGSAEDNILSLRAVLLGRGLCLDEALIDYRQNPDGLGNWIFARHDDSPERFRRRYERTVRMYRDVAEDIAAALEKLPDISTQRRALAQQVIALYRIEADARSAILDQPRRAWLGPIWRGLCQPGLRRKSAERALKLLLPRRWFGLRS
ncbi:glycosyl transferase family 2 [Tahibacter aquaticus]|uniref:Glycosyl transferase family 2 n=1 Tax=Tahibacter aquaticus TaxID=520092 RepID=A0A4R6YJW6_9GAMM|nr:glycosyltransferase [Tahibacter aquaticus]TDR37352.1 glycosyl transferase family 2 [Tahibacter aquaticus]